MNDAKWAKYAALGGPAFVVLALLGGFLPGNPVAMNATSEKIQKYFTDHDKAIEVGAVLGGFAIIGFVWWFGSLFRRMAKAEDGRVRVSVVALLGLAITIPLFLMSNVIFASVALRFDEVQGAARFFYAMGLMAGAISNFGFVVFLIAVTSLNYRTKMFPAWTNYAGSLGALGMLLGTLNLVTDAPAWFVIGLIGFLSAAIWILALSWDLWKSPAAA
jgi:hypothetical protein